MMNEVREKVVSVLCRVFERYADFFLEKFDEFEREGQTPTTATMLATASTRSLDTHAHALCSLAGMIHRFLVKGTDHGDS